jgi:hypothetical protein
MERRRFKWITAVMISGALFSFFACSDDSKVSGKGEVDFEITDAPSDDSNIKSVMVTVAEVKVNGESLSGFTKQTIDLKAYQEGNTKLLGTTELAAKSYSNITLVLDLDADANGNAPGCYVLTHDDVKFRLKSSSTGKMNVTINQAWSVAGDAKNRIILDFDLRKSIRYSDDPSIRYSFVSDTNLGAAVRIVAKERSGTIKGTYEEETTVNAEKIIVYAYKKGTFNASVETEPQTTDNLYFKNAVASAEVKESLTGKAYTLAFLEEGDYELHFIAYNKNPDTGRYAYAARLQSETSVNGQVGNIIQVKAGASVNISSSIKGII